MLIEQPPCLLRRLYPRATWRMEPSEKAVYITFDDGPIPEATPWVLDVLDRYGVKATFFVVGDNVRKYPELFREVLRRGHSVGNHTFHHISGHIHGDYHFKQDVDECQAIMATSLSPFKRGKEDALANRSFTENGHSTPLPCREGPGGGLEGSGAYLPLFRPPHGWMKPNQYRYVAARYRVIMWDLVTRDYSNRLNADDVVHNIKRYARNGSIITFHDSLKSIDKLRTALPESIEWLLAQGYALKPL